MKKTNFTNGLFRSISFLKYSAFVFSTLLALNINAQSFSWTPAASQPAPTAPVGGAANGTPGFMGLTSCASAYVNAGSAQYYTATIPVAGVAATSQLTAINTNFCVNSWAGDWSIDIIDPNGTAFRVLQGSYGNSSAVTMAFQIVNSNATCAAAAAITTPGIVANGNNPATKFRSSNPFACTSTLNGNWQVRFYNPYGQSTLDTEGAFLNSVSLVFAPKPTITVAPAAGAVATGTGGVCGNPTLISTTVTNTPSTTVPANCIDTVFVNYTLTAGSTGVSGATLNLAGLLPAGTVISSPASAIIGPANYGIGKTLAGGTNVVACNSASGATAQYAVVVNCVSGPSIVCPANIVENLEPGECTTAASYPCPTLCGITGNTLAAYWRQDFPVAPNVDPKSNPAVGIPQLDGGGLGCGLTFAYTGRVFPALPSVTNNRCVSPLIYLRDIELAAHIGTAGVASYRVNVYSYDGTSPNLLTPGGNIILVSTFTAAANATSNIASGLGWQSNYVTVAPAAPIALQRGVSYYIEAGGTTSNTRVGTYNANGTETAPTYFRSATAAGGQACTVGGASLVNAQPMANLGFPLKAVLRANIVAPATATLVSGPAPDQQIGPGLYNICYSATDANNVVVNCCFTYEVRPYSGPLSGVMSCNDFLNVSLDTVCSSALGADMFLEGGPYKCYDNYKVQMSSVSMNGPWYESIGCGNTIYNDNKIHLCAANIGKTYWYRVIDLNNQNIGTNSCWGQFKVEDKVAPKISCPANQTLDCNESLDPCNLLSNSLIGTSVATPVNTNTAVASDDTVTVSANAIGDPNMIIKGWYIRVRKLDGVWIGDGRARISTPWGASYPVSLNPTTWFTNAGGATGTGSLFFYAPANATEAVAGGWRTPSSAVPFPLPNQLGCTAGVTGNTLNGQFSVRIWDDFPGDAYGNVQIEVYAIPAACADLPAGLVLGTQSQYLDPLNFPAVNTYRITGKNEFKVKAGVLDACTESTLKFNDVVTEFTCSSTQDIIKSIVRTYTAVDASGNTARCSHTISVRKGSLAGVSLPPNYDGQPGQMPVLNICTDFWPDGYDLCGLNPLGYRHGTVKWVKKANGYPAAKVSEVYTDGQAIGGDCGTTLKIIGNDAFIIGEFDFGHDIDNPGTDTMCLRGTGMPGGQVCGTINMLYNDTPLPTCGDGYKLLRDWRILDWCNGEIKNHTQVIKVQDMSVPVVTCPPNITVSTDGLDCTGSGAFPAPKVSDVCSSTSYEIYYSGGDALPTNAIITKLADGSYRYSGFICGNYNFRYVVSDACGNRAECSGFKMTVRDITVPVAVCRSLTEVTLTNTVDDPTTTVKECGLTRVEAYKFDEGSWDNCGPVYFKVKRVVNANIYDGNGNFDDYAYFNCEDVGVEREVILRVYDQQPIAGHVTDTYRPSNTCGSNFNDCVVKVNVKDLVNPTLLCPSNITIECASYDFSIPLTNADTAWFNKYLGKIVRTDCNGVNASSLFTYYTGFGNATANNGYAFDNCFVNIKQDITSEMSCGVGTITRTFQAIDKGGRTSPSCRQLIYVVNNSPFRVDNTQYTDPGNDLADPCDGTEYHRVGIVDYVKDPRDGFYTITCTPGVDKNGNGIFGEYPADCDSTWNINADRAVTILTQDDIVWPDQYVEIETCQGKDSIGTSCEKGKGAGSPRFLRNNKCDLLGISYKDEYFPIELPACKKIIRTWTVVDWCQDKPAGRKWTYQQFIKFTNKVAPNFTGNSCKNDTICQYPVDCGPDPVTLTASAEDDCTPAGSLKYRAVVDLNNNGTVDLTSNGSSVTITKNHGLKYGTHMITWSVEDGCGNVKTCTKSFLVKDCKRPTPVAKLLSIELMPGLCMAVLEASKVNNFSWDNCTPMSELRFRLAKAGTYTANMTLDEVLALDDKVTFTGSECGTQSVALFVIDNDGNFDYTETVIIVQSNLDPACCGGPGTTVNVTGTIKTETGEDVQDVKIMVNGTNLTVTPSSGLFNVLLKAGGNITVAPEKDINPMNGVSTADLVAINKHILGISSLNSPYKQIAADVNKDKRISTADMVELRKMILYIQTNFNNNKSWRFVDKSYNFTTNNPLTENFNESINFANLQGNQSVNFVAAKIGDVNGSASPNQLVSGEERGNGTLVFDAENATLAAGETKTIEFKAADIANIGGYQFTMNFDKEAIEVMEMAGTDMTANNFGMLLNEGAITTSFDGKVSSDVVFTMTVKAKKNVQLSDVISVGSRFTVAEAYTLNGDKMDVALSFNGKVAGTFELFQNQPNPFNGKTVVGFTMPQAGNATITVFDAAGRTVKVVEMNAVKGYNQVILDKSELSAGVLSYRLTTAGFSATKQMIVTE